MFEPTSRGLVRRFLPCGTLAGFVITVEAALDKSDGARSLLAPAVPEMLLGVADDPAEAAPLSMLIMASVQASWRARSASRALVTAQFTDALRRLGFEAELLPAAVTVSREDLPTVPAVSFGSPKAPRTLSADRAHYVVMTRSFGAMMDPSVFTDDLVRPLFQGLDPAEAKPTMVPLDVSLKASAVGIMPSIRRGPLVVSWQLDPMGSPASGRSLELDKAEVARGGENLARVVVDLLKVAVLMGDHSELYRLYPQLDPSSWDGGQPPVGGDR